MIKNEEIEKNFMHEAISLIDFGRFDRTTNGKKKLQLYLLEMYMNRSDGYIQLLLFHAQNENWTEVINIADGIKGVIGNIGAERIFTAIDNAERSWRKKSPDSHDLLKNICVMLGNLSMQVSDYLQYIKNSDSHLAVET
jgi:hypothetical protein